VSSGRQCEPLRVYVLTSDRNMQITSQARCPVYCTVVKSIKMMIHTTMTMRTEMIMKKMERMVKKMTKMWTDLVVLPASEQCPVMSSHTVSPLWTLHNM